MVTIDLWLNGEYRRRFVTRKFYNSLVKFAWNNRLKLDIIILEVNAK